MELICKESSEHTADTLKQVSDAAECSCCRSGHSVELLSICCDIADESVYAVCREYDAYQEPYPGNQETFEHTDDYRADRFCLLSFRILDKEPVQDTDDDNGDRADTDCSCSTCDFIHIHGEDSGHTEYEERVHDAAETFLETKEAFLLFLRTKETRCLDACGPVCDDTGDAHQDEDDAAYGKAGECGEPQSEGTCRDKGKRQQFPCGELVRDDSAYKVGECCHCRIAG